MKLRVEQEINEYQKSIKSNRFFMMNNLEEELKYISHNKKRYISALREIDKLISKFKKHYIYILDIGTSPFTFIIRKRYKNAQIYSIDYSDKFKKLCESKGVHFKKVDLNREKISFKKVKFDLVVFLEVLEHLSTNHNKVIKNVAQTMSINGFCILQTPNKYSPKAIAAAISSGNMWNELSKTSTKGDEFTHAKEYSLNELSQLIRKYDNLKIIKKEHSMYFDEIDSVLVYRKYAKLFKPLIRINYFIVKNMRFLRRGMQVIFQKAN